MAYLTDYMSEEREFEQQLGTFWELKEPRGRSFVSRWAGHRRRPSAEQPAQTEPRAEQLRGWYRVPAIGFLYTTVTGDLPDASYLKIAIPSDEQHLDEAIDVARHARGHNIITITNQESFLRGFLERNEFSDDEAYRKWQHALLQEEQWSFQPTYQETKARMQRHLLSTVRGNLEARTNDLLMTRLAMEIQADVHQDEERAQQTAATSRGSR